MIEMRENSGKPWTPEEDERSRELAASGAGLTEIAEKLNRTVPATKARAYIIRVKFGRFGAKLRGLSKSG
jgi:hypothetical protein